MLQFPWTIKTVVKTGQNYMMVSLIWWRLWGQVKRGVCRVTKLHQNKSMCDQNEFSGSRGIQGMVWYWLRWDNLPEFGLVYAGTAGLERNNAIVPDHPKVFVVTLSLSLVASWWFKILLWINKTSYHELVKHRGGQWPPVSDTKGTLFPLLLVYWWETMLTEHWQCPNRIRCCQLRLPAEVLAILCSLKLIHFCCRIQFIPSWSQDSSIFMLQCVRPQDPWWSHRSPRQQVMTWKAWMLWVTKASQKLSGEDSRTVRQTVGCFHGIRASVR